MLGSKLPKPDRVIITERHKDRRRTAVGTLTGAGRARRPVRLHEDRQLRHEEDGGRVLPADAEPLGFSPGMQERSGTAVLRQAADPSGDHIAIERRVEPYAAGPWLAKALG